MEIKPVNWKQFRSWDHEKQKEYLDFLDETYAPTAGMLAEMFRTTAVAVAQYRCRNGLGVGKRGRKTSGDPEAWEKFIRGEEPVKESTINSLMMEAAKLLPEGAEIHVVYRW